MLDYLLGNVRDVIIISLCAFAMVGLFVMAPAPGDVYLGDDWAVFRNASLAAVNGGELYGVDFGPVGGVGMYYYNPPWFAVALVPLTLVAERLGWALLSTSTLGAIAALLWRWADNLSVIRLLLAILSPITLQTLIHGQPDVLLLASVFVPGWLWPVTMTIKPQTTIALLAIIPRRDWVRAALVGAAIFVGSLIWFGWWPADWLEMSRSEPNNLLSSLWPATVPLGIACIWYAVSRSDERAAVLASPLLFSYIRIHSLVGIWLVVVATLRLWQVIGLWVLTWLWVLNII